MAAKVIKNVVVFHAGHLVHGTLLLADSEQDLESEGVRRAQLAAAALSTPLRDLAFVLHAQISTLAAEPLCSTEILVFRRAQVTAVAVGPT